MQVITKTNNKFMILVVLLIVLCFIMTPFFKTAMGACGGGGISPPPGFEDCPIAQPCNGGPYDLINKKCSTVPCPSSQYLWVMFSENDVGSCCYALKCSADCCIIT